jgi:hypothetical protein
LRDESDKPVVQSAIDHKCVLVIDDFHTYYDAKIYTETLRCREIYRHEEQNSVDKI